MFAVDNFLHVSHARYDNILITLQLSADKVLDWPTYNFTNMHPQKSKDMIITLVLVLACIVYIVALLFKYFSTVFYY